MFFTFIYIAIFFFKSHNPLPFSNPRAGQGPTSGGHTWLQDPSASSGSGEPKRVPSPLMAVLRETWFIGAVGAAGFLALSVFVAVVCYRRKRNEKRAMGGTSFERERERETNV